MKTKNNLANVALLLYIFGALMALLTVSASMTVTVLSTIGAVDSDNLLPGVILMLVWAALVPVSFVLTVVSYILSIISIRRFPSDKRPKIQLIIFALLNVIEVIAIIIVYLK